VLSSASSGCTSCPFRGRHLDKLAIGDTLQIKASGLGLEIEGFPTSSSTASRRASRQARHPRGRRKARGARGQGNPGRDRGPGRRGGSLFGNWHIQTCFAPDIERFGLASSASATSSCSRTPKPDYGRGYYKGGATIGVVCGGPSDVSGLGVGVTPILSTRSGKSRADRPGGEYREVPRPEHGQERGRARRGRGPSPGRQERQPRSHKDNEASLIVTAVDGVVQPTSGREYSVTYDGRPWLDLGMASINYNVSLGDPTYGWAQGDHVEPDVTIQGRDRPSPSECAVAILACIGNEAEVVSGEARGGKGYYIGRHAGSDDKVWFPKDVVEKLALNDRSRSRPREWDSRSKGSRTSA